MKREPESCGKVQLIQCAPHACTGDRNAFVEIAPDVLCAPRVHGRPGGC